MRRFNLYRAELDNESQRPGFRWRRVRVGEAIGAEQIGASLYELPPGERTFPYHFHYGVEEWLLVLSGRPTVRSPDGDRELRPGDAVCFPRGPDGAHLVRNDSDQPVRVLMLSTLRTPSISMYPDSDKIGARPGVPDDTLNFLRGDAVDYWEGE